MFRSKTGVALCAVLAMTLVGCGGSDDSSATVPPPTDAGTDTTAASTATDDSTSSVAETSVPDTAAPASLDALLEKYYAGTFRDLPTSAPTPVTDKAIWVITLASASPSVANVAQGVTDAGNLLGWTTTVFDGAGSPTAWNDGVRQAIAAQADAIVLAIVECQPVQATLQQAKEAGLKIYGVVGNDCDIPEVGGTAMFDGAIFKAVPGGPTAMTKDTATARAAWVTSVGGDSAQIIEMTEPDYMGVTIASAAFHDALAEVCAGCAVSEVPFNLTDLYGPELRAKTEAGLLQNPDANVITFPYDTALLLGGAAAVAGADRSAPLKVMGGECLAPNVELIRTGGGQDACVALPYPWMGWAAVDALNRIFQGEAEVDSGIGTQLVDKDHNLPAEGVTYDGIGDYQTNYKKIWGVG
ncbi:MAG TPA: substrate-binding domain-containing protein [Ilumatobacteraceae bacterium]|nr:substrate-binding domain-containing protein [Ilumatobacteraceae bacterium]